MWVDKSPLTSGFVHSPRPTLATLQGLPDGPEGTGVTLRAMRASVRAAVRDPRLIIRQTALAILQTVPQRKWLREVLALHAWVRDHIRYVRDPVGVQIVQDPDKTLEQGQGNCVQKAVLLSSLLEATGHPTRFVALVIAGQQNGEFSHVITETKVGSKWMPLETIIPVQAGWYPPDAIKRYELNVS